MKKIFLFVLLLSCSFFVFAQANASVDIDDDIYSILSIAETKGLCKPLLNVKPYTQNYILEKVEEIKNNIENSNYKDNIKNSEIEYLEKYIKKFETKIGFDFQNLSYRIQNNNEKFPVSLEFNDEVNILGSAGVYKNSTQNAVGFDFYNDFNFVGDITKYFSYKVTFFAGLTYVPLQDMGTYKIGEWWYSNLEHSIGVALIIWNFTPTTEYMFTQHLHRHPWVDTQALVYWVTKDEKYVQSIVDVYSDWLETYPCPVAGADSYYMGMGHASYRIWCNLQACARIETYIKVLQYCKESESLTPEFLSELLVSLYDCVECIRANYYYTDSGNIRQSETQAVLNMAVMMPEYRKADEWLDEAIGDTERFLDELLMDDGVLVEKDPSYHIGVLATCYEAHQVLSANNKENLLPADYFSRLKNGVYFVRDLVYPDYSVEDCKEFSKKATPDFEVATAIRISSSMPRCSLMTRLSNGLQQDVHQVLRRQNCCLSIRLPDGTCSVRAGRSRT